MPENTTKYSSMGWIKHTKLTTEFVMKIVTKLITARTAVNNYTTTRMLGAVIKSGVSKWLVGKWRPRMRTVRNIKSKLMYF